MSTYYRYVTKGDSNRPSNWIVRYYSTLGIVLFLIGLVESYPVFIDGEYSIHDFRIPIAGLVCIGIGCYKSLTATYFYVTMDEDYIKVFSDYGNIYNIIPYKELNKVDIQNNHIYLHHKSDLRTDINLSLITPEEEREKLKLVLQEVIENYELVS